MKYKGFLVLILVFFLLQQFNFLSADEETTAMKGWRALKNDRSLKIVEITIINDNNRCKINLRGIKSLLERSGVMSQTTVYLKSNKGKIIAKLGVFKPMNSRKRGSRGVKFLAPDSMTFKLIKFDDPLLINSYEDPFFLKKNSKNSIAKKRIFNNYSLIFKNSNGIIKGITPLGLVIDNGSGMFPKRG